MLESGQGWCSTGALTRNTLTFKQITRSSNHSLIRTCYPKAIGALHSALKMANIFQYESNIEKCNDLLLQTLAELDRGDDEVDLADLVVRYAYDILFATTVGAPPGFLASQLNTAKLTDAAEKWKFMSVIPGSYLRLHPVITGVIKLFGLCKAYDRDIRKHIRSDTTTGNSAMQILDKHEHGDGARPSTETWEACIALIIAASDPAITHLLASLFYIYQDPTLVTRVRNEIKAASISHPPKLKELIHGRPQMRLLHATLQESLRLIRPHGHASRYTVAQGGVTIGGKHIPGGVSLTAFAPIPLLSFGWPVLSLRAKLGCASFQELYGPYSCKFATSLHSCYNHPL